MRAATLSGRFAIGVMAAVMGVTVAKMLIPANVLLYGIDIKARRQPVARRLLPTMLVAFAR